MYYVWVEIYHIIVLIIGLRMRPPAPPTTAGPPAPNRSPRTRPVGPSAAVRAPGRSARRRPLASARLGPAALRIEMKKEERMRELWYNVQGLKILYYFVSLKEIDIII